jgi:hypothetical protein
VTMWPWHIFWLTYPVICFALSEFDLLFCCVEISSLAHYFVLLALLISFQQAPVQARLEYVQLFRTSLKYKRIRQMENPLCVAVTGLLCLMNTMKRE